MSSNSRSRSSSSGFPTVLHTLVKNQKRNKTVNTRDTYWEPVFLDSGS